MKKVGLLLLFPMLTFAQVNREKAVLDKMIRACQDLKSASFILHTTERIKTGGIERGEMLVKLQHSPLCMYLHLYSPNAGTEILCRKDEWNDVLCISPGGFPYINMKLSQDNPKVRKNSHHSVGEIGFDYLVRMVTHYYKVMGDKVFDFLTLGDTIAFDYSKCVKMEFDYPDFGYKEYTVKPGENIVQIAAQNFVNEYMIISANKNIDNLNDVKPGDRILIPNMFGRKVIFFVDLKTMLPLIQEIHDEKGFFERYEYRSFVLNPDFDQAEFTVDYKDYGF